MKKISLIIASFLILILTIPAFAQTAIISSPTITIGNTISTMVCPQLTTTLSYGKYDSTTGGQVSMLQNFLYQKGYLSVTPTGYFGPLTLQAVKIFQKVSASGAVDGIVGVQTRAHIIAACGGPIAVPPTATAPVINSITPSSGTTGSTVTITGSNFTPTGNIVHFAIGGIGNLSAAVIPTPFGQPMLEQITFTVPSYIGPYCKPTEACPMYAMVLNAGTYPVSVENANGTSNPVQFTVTNNATLIPN